LKMLMLLQIASAAKELPLSLGSETSYPDWGL
jgi:hypothetical protein